MKLLLDENLPLSLRHEFYPPIEVVTVQFMRWEGRKNGGLVLQVLSLIVPTRFILADN